FQTSEYHPLAEVRNQTIHPYSDMLLHDMGAGLADTLGEGVASGSEWRTTPLWGLGLAPCVTGGVVNPSGREGGESCSPHEAYLHDGRARTLDEAIMWHGGEGATSRAAYDALSTADKALMIHFLKSL
ncbi:MAG TPA: thiol oxidoreductase, partial [Gammaproteobacteria bacterium]|nr:thiol oxidoreductase [Gammaproteobacteria bacterium]